MLYFSAYCLRLLCTWTCSRPDRNHFSGQGVPRQPRGFRCRGPRCGRRRCPRRRGRCPRKGGGGGGIRRRHGMSLFAEYMYLRLTRDIRASVCSTKRTLRHSRDDVSFHDLTKSYLTMLSLYITCVVSFHEYSIHYCIYYVTHRMPVRLKLTSTSERRRDTGHSARLKRGKTSLYLWQALSKFGMCDEGRV